MRDLFNHVNPLRGISPAAATADNTAWVSQIIDTQGYGGLLWLLNFGALADADATFTTLVEHGDAANLSDAAAIPDDLLQGTEVLASATFADDNATRKIGVQLVKRYQRLTVTPAANAGNAFLSALALLHNPMVGPTPNPPA